MVNRILDLLIGLCIGQFLPLTIVVFGFTVHWAFLCLCTVASYLLLKKLFHSSLKLGWFLMNKLVLTVKAEVLKELMKEVE
ncbi:hypothetical protein [Planococcus sp. CAU13]|uniref:hypothetical protein n=1 Tax=Planococcus sp. CAU13 TaxID=1541197 RepID=UPI0005300BD5|nr:hypothetical protein [Planococcus sp. CAU13]